MCRNFPQAFSLSFPTVSELTRGLSFAFFANSPEGYLSNLRGFLVFAVSAVVGTTDFAIESVEILAEIQVRCNSLPI